MKRLFPVAAFILVLCDGRSSEPPRKIFLVAGQSNVLNWHADAAALPADVRDKSVLFYYHTGAPPSRAAQPFNATSGDTWTTLAPQRQEPYKKYYRYFFGPEMTLARALLDGGVTRLGLVKSAYFGSNLAVQWNPSISKGDQLYALFRQQAKTALHQLKSDGENFTIAGFFWMQGEADAASAKHAEAYAANLEKLIGQIRQDFGVPDLPVVLGRIGPKDTPGQKTVRQAQVQAAARLAHTAWVDTDDLPRDTDGVHLLAPGEIELGRRFAAAWFKLTKSAPASSP